MAFFDSKAQYKLSQNTINVQLFLTHKNNASNRSAQAKNSQVYVLAKLAPINTILPESFTKPKFGIRRFIQTMLAGIYYQLVNIFENNMHNFDATEIQLKIEIPQNALQIRQQIAFFADIETYKTMIRQYEINWRNLQLRFGAMSLESERKIRKLKQKKTELRGRLKQRERLLKANREKLNQADFQINQFLQELEQSKLSHGLVTAAKDYYQQALKIKREDIKTLQSQLNDVQHQLHKQEQLFIREKVKHKQEMKTLSHTNQQKIVALSTQHQTLVAEKQHVINTLTEKYQETLKSIRLKHKQIQDWKRKLSQQIEEKDAQIQALQDKLNDNSREWSARATKIATLNETVQGKFNQMKNNYIQLLRNHTALEIKTRGDVEKYKTLEHQLQESQLANQNLLDVSKKVQEELRAQQKTVVQLRQEK